METKEKAEGLRLIVSVSPHIRSEESVSRIMWTVNLALFPATFMSVYFFGLRAVYVLSLSILSAVFFEWAFQRLTNRTVTTSDGSAFLTGLLLGLNLPSGVPFYLPIMGSFVAIVITKHLFGGLGYNIFNPALIGRAFLLLTWPRIMTTWLEPAGFTVDAKTTATPLMILKEEGIDKLLEVFGDKTDLYIHLFTGQRAGSLGETSVIAILLGGLFLLWRGYITWHIPLSFLGSAALLAWIFGGKGALFSGDPLIHLMSGGIMLGAFFMATDYVTSPMVRTAQIIFGIGCGFLTMLIRLKGGYPEGVMFAILIMNCFAPLLDRGFKTKVFGARKGQKR